MSVLKGLNLVAMPRPTSISPEIARRNKLIGHLREQLAIANADAKGEIHIVRKRRWDLTEDGQKHLIDVDKRLKRWWIKNSNNTIVLCIRWANRPLEFEKGKTGISLPDDNALTDTLERLIAAAEVGEFDPLISAAYKQRISRR